MAATEPAPAESQPALYVGEGQVESVDAEGITSVWKPSAEELAALVAGGGVCITICQHVQPVMALGVVTADCLQVSV